MTRHVINIVSLIGSSMAVKQSDGEKVYDKIVNLLEREEQIELDFSGIDILLSIFLNNAIGKLYGTKYKTALEDGRVSVSHMSEQDLATLEIVKKRAVAFFATQGKK